MAVTVTEVTPAPDRGQITEWSLTTGGPVTPWPPRRGQITEWSLTTGGPVTPWPPRRGQITEWSLFRRPGSGWHVGRVVW